MPSNVTTIDEEAFFGCESLREVQLNNVLNTLGEDAFNSCFCLAFIEIPASITIVGSGNILQLHFIENGCSQRGNNID
jgi:hypothetical protein